MPWEDNANNTSGIPQTFKAGAYFTDKIGKNNGAKIGFNYSYYNTQLEAISASRSQYYLTDTTYFTDDSTRNFNRNQSHNVNFNFKAPLDSLTTIEIRPSFNYDIASDDNSDLTTFINNAQIQSLQTSVGNNNKSTGIGLSGMAKINRKFKKKKRELEVRYDVDFTDNKTDGNLNVAKRENSVILQEKDYQTTYSGFDPNSPLAHIMMANYQSAFMASSVKFASKVEEQFLKNYQRKSFGVKQAGFLVIWRTAMPSVLIETGFLTNPDEENYLASEKGQKEVAEGIAKAFKQYKEEIER